MKKQILALVCIFALLVTCFCACSGNKTTSSTPASSAATSSAASAATSSTVPEDKVVELTWWRYNTTQCPDEAAVHAAISDYVAKLNISLNIVHQQTDYQTLLQAALAAKQSIDIVWGNINYVNSFLGMNALYDFSADLAEFPELKASIPDKVWNAVTRPTGLYAVPCYKESAIGASLMIPTSIVESFKWDLSGVKSIADMAPYFKELYESKTVKYVYQPSYICSARPGGAYPLIDEVASIYNYLGVAVDDPTKIVVIPETQAYQDQVAVMQDYVKKGYIDADALNLKLTPKDSWAVGDLGFYDWSTVPDQVANATQRYGTDMTIVNVTGQYMNNASALGSAYEITSLSKNPKVALKFLQALYTDEKLADLVLFGIEGTHYKVNSEKRIEKIDNSGYSYDAWCCVNVMTPTLMASEAADKKEQYKKFNDDSATSILLGFYVDESSITAEISAMNAVVSTYQAAVERGFETAEIDREKYIAALYDAGLQKVVDEVQKQYTEWLKNK